MKSKIIFGALSLVCLNSFAQSTNTSQSIVDAYNAQQAEFNAEKQQYLQQAATATKTTSAPVYGGTCGSDCITPQSLSLIPATPTAAAALIPTVAAVAALTSPTASPTATPAPSAVIPTVATPAASAVPAQTTKKYRQVLYSCDQWNTYVGGKLKNPGNPAGGKQYNLGGLAAISDNGWYAVKLNITYGMQAPSQYGYGGAVMGIYDVVDAQTGAVLSSTVNGPVSVGSCENSYNNWTF